MSSVKLYGSIFLTVALLLTGLWFLLYGGGEEPAVPTTRQPQGFSGLETPENLIDFDILGQTLPDEDYQPIYPETLKNLQDQEVVIRGFMTPFDSLEDMQFFMVMGFPTGCNFCAPPTVDQVVLARQPFREKAYEYIDGPIEVTGKLALWLPESEDPAHRDDFFLYVMNDVKVRALPPESYREPEEHRQ